MSNGIFLTMATFAGLTQRSQDEILGALGLGLQLDESELLADDSVGDDEQPYDISAQQMARLVEGCSDKTRSVLRAIAEHGRHFRWREIADHLAVEAGSLRSAWGGITKRTRTVVGDKNADFVWWTPLDQGDFAGEISQVTFNSLRKVFAVT